MVSFCVACIESIKLNVNYFSSAKAFSAVFETFGFGSVLASANIAESSSLYSGLCICLKASSAASLTPESGSFLRALTIAEIPGASVIGTIFPSFAS